MFLFNSKLNDCAEWKTVQGESAYKTDIRTVSYKHRTERILVYIK